MFEDKRCSGIYVMVYVMVFGIAKHARAKKHLNIVFDIGYDCVFAISSIVDNDRNTEPNSTQKY